MKLALALVLGLTLLPSLAVSCSLDKIKTKFDLWNEPSCLRGANIWQKAVEPGDDKGAIGPGPFGPPFSNRAFELLSQWGANLITASLPGFYTEVFPFELNEKSQANWDDLVSKAEAANLFLVIGFRTGPGRTEKALTPNGSATDHLIWKSQQAQDAWVEMWRKVAERYRNSPNVVGYDLMIEPNSNGAVLNIFDPEPFFSKHGNSLYNWYPLAERIIRAIREVDSETPILVGGMNWSSADWLDSIPRMPDSKVVYLVHHYEPVAYSHQKQPNLVSYPGEYDGDYDGKPDYINKKFIFSLLKHIPAFQHTRKAPVAVTEFGTKRWAPGADRYFKDMWEVLDSYGVSSSIWHWESDFAGVDWDDFNFRHGPDPNVHKDVSSPLEQAIRSAWAKNSVRPSQVKNRFPESRALASRRTQQPRPYRKDVGSSRAHSRP